MIGFTQVLDSLDRLAVGTWIKLPTVDSVELLALAGFDFVVVDMEHAPLDIGVVHVLIGAALGRGLPALVRVPSGDAAGISRVLDSGAAGVLVPHVDSVSDAASVVAAGRFPPHGTRGFGPTTRAGAWGSDACRYRESGERVAVIPQLESADAIAAASQIANVDGLAALFVGQADLAVATGLSATSTEFAAHLSTAETAARDVGIPIGTAIGLDTDAVPDLAQRYDFVMVANDAALLGHGASAVLNSIKTY